MAFRFLMLGIFFMYNPIKQNTNLNSVGFTSAFKQIVKYVSISFCLQDVKNHKINHNNRAVCVI
jgi:hypothetical protein